MENIDLSSTVFTDQQIKEITPILEQIGLLDIKKFHIKLHSKSNDKTKYIEQLDDVIQHYIYLIPNIIKKNLIPNPIVINDGNDD